MVASPVVSLRRPFKGGTESFIVNLANALVDKGHTVDVLAKNADETDLFQCIELEPSAFSMKDALHDEEWGQKYYQALQLGLMDLDRYDVIHMNSYLPILYDLACLKKTPIVTTLHTPPDDAFGTLHQLHSARSSETQYVAVSNRLRSTWQPLISGNINIIANGIDVSQWQSSYSCRREGYAWVGRICPVKNPKDAIEIAHRLDQKLVIAGPIVDADYFETYIKPRLSDNIRYLGHLNNHELITALDQCHTLLATALWEEPFGLSVLECLALEMSVVGYATAVPPELRETSSVFVTQANSCEHVINYLKNRVLNRSGEQGSGYFSKARSHAERFSLNTMCKQYERIYQRATQAEAHGNNVYSSSR